MTFTNLHVDLSAFLRLDPRTLNDLLLEIGIWTVERNIAHKVRVSFQPNRDRIRFDFVAVSDSRAFMARFRAVERPDDADLGAIFDQPGG